MRFMFALTLLRRFFLSGKRTFARYEQGAMIIGKSTWAEYNLHKRQCRINLSVCVIEQGSNHGKKVKRTSVLGDQGRTNWGGAAYQFSTKNNFIN